MRFASCSNMGSLGLNTECCANGFLTAEAIAAHPVREAFGMLIPRQHLGGGNLPGNGEDMEMNSAMRQ